MKKRIHKDKKLPNSEKREPKRNISKKILYKLADSPLPEIAFIASFILSRWWLNSDFSYPSEIWIPVIMFGLVGVVAFYGYRLIFGRGGTTHLAAILLTYSFYGYNFLHDKAQAAHLTGVIPSGLRSGFAQSVIFGLVFVLLAGLIAWGARQLINRLKLLQSLQPYKILLFAVAFIFIVQAVRVTGRYIQIHNELSYHYPAPTAKPSLKNQKDRPDIYYILFDRYGNEEQLAKNLGIDNSDVMNYLASKGFTNRPQAFSNYPFTMSSVSSTLAMNYFPQFEQKFGDDGNWQAAFPYRSVLKNPPIAQLLRQDGYKYNQLSSWWDFTRLGINADSNPTESFRLDVFGAHFYLSDLERDILNKSILSPWLKKGLSVGNTDILKYSLDRNPQENFKAQMEALHNIAAREDKSTPQFTFAHILAPHPPYVFNADGTWPEYDQEANDNGVDETVKYSNEVTYINKQIKSLVSQIQQHDPGAVVVFQADEGPYPKQFRGPMSPSHFYDPLQLPQAKMQQKFGVFASYYLPGIPREKTDQLNTSVNTFRFILNNYLGYNMPLLPACNFATGDKYKIYNYTLVTDKITGSAAPSTCKQYE